MSAGAARDDIRRSFQRRETPATSGASPPSRRRRRIAAGRDEIVLKRGLAAAVALLLAFGVVTWLALEASDVAVLETHGADASARRTRVWFAEHDGALWLEAPVPDREWLLDVQASPRVRLERAGVMQVYDAVPVAGGGHAEIRALLRAKYGWRDWWVGLLQDTSHSIAVRLVPPATG